MTSGAPEGYQYGIILIAEKQLCIIFDSNDTTIAIEFPPVAK
jgi:hypothetical protein